MWNPVTGEISKAVNFYQENGRTFVDLNFNPNGSAFVVFRKPIFITKNNKTTNKSFIFNDLKEIKGSWQVSFDIKWGGPKSVTFDKLVSWTDRIENGIKYYSGKAIYKTTFDLNTPLKEVKIIDLGVVKDVGIAKVKLNGKDLGILWCPPYRVSVAGLLKEKGNILEIEVVNTWRNRLIGDREKPDSQRFTKTNITINPDWKLEPSGLLGPVRLLKIEEK